MSGLFGTMNTAISGMSAQQKAIDVTSHNISNANTEGYSRQRATLESNSPYTISDISNPSEAQAGRGVTVTSIDRIRDSFLDYQIRTETSTKGTYDKRESYLSQVESIINGTSDTGLSTLMGKFYSAWQDLSKNPQTSNARTVVAEQSSALADELNHTYNQLQDLKKNCQSTIKDEVFEVNDKLEQLDQLNKQIMSVKVSGNEPNDLMDKRDLLLDQLSTKFNINIDKENFDTVNVSPANTSGIKFPNLIQSDDSTSEKRFSYVSSITKGAQNGSAADGSPIYEYKVGYYKKGDTSNQNNMESVKVNMTEAQAKQLDENRVLWADKDGKAIGVSVDEASSTITEPAAGFNFSDLKLFTPDNGEITGTASVQTDIDNYTNQLNKIAKALAFSVNAIESGMTNPTSANAASASGKNTQDTDYMPFFVNSDSANSKYTKDANGKTVLCDLTSSTTKAATLSNLTDVLGKEDEITAGNISVNRQIMENVMDIKTRTNDDQFADETNNTIDGNTDGKRALAIAQLANSIMNIQNINDTTKRSDFIATLAVDSNGVNTVVNAPDGMTLNNYFKDTVDKLAVQEQQAKRIVTNQTTLLAGFTQTKSSISGVSIDEEMANLIQYQHAYQANAKVISTVDSLLDVVVNGLKK